LGSLNSRISERRLTHLLRDSRTSTLNRSSSRILSSSLENSRRYRQSWSRDSRAFARLSRCGSCVLASCVASPEARTSACNSRGRRKAVPCCAPFRDRKVEGRSWASRWSMHAHSIQTLRATAARVCVRCDSKDDGVSRRRWSWFEQFLTISKTGYLKRIMQTVHNAFYSSRFPIIFQQPPWISPKRNILLISGEFL